LRYEKVAVTGGSGRLGSFVVSELMAHCAVTVIDLKPPLADTPYIEADVCDLDALRKAFKGHDAVVHLGALDLAIPAKPEEFMRVNTMGTWNALQAAHECGITRFVQCSSVAATGCGDANSQRPNYLPLDEAHPVEPIHPYGVSKRVGEIMARSFSRDHRLEVVVFRPVLVLFPDAVAKVAEDIRTSVDRRLFCYVTAEDAARGFRLALELEQVAYEVFFLSASDSNAPGDTLDVLTERFGATPHLRKPHLYEENPRASAIDNERARRVLGWEPTSNWQEVLAKLGN